MFVCVLVCEPALVDSISVAQTLRGCTVIQGALEIQIRGGSKSAMSRCLPVSCLDVILIVQ